MRYGLDYHLFQDGESAPRPEPDIQFVRGVGVTDREMRRRMNQRNETIFAALKSPATFGNQRVPDGMTKIVEGRMSLVGTGFIDRESGFSAVKVFEDGIDVTHRLTDVQLSNYHDKLIAAYLEGPR